MEQSSGFFSAADPSINSWNACIPGEARGTAFAAAWEALAPQLFLLQMSGWWEEELRSHLKGAFLLFFFFLKKKGI